MWTYIIKRILLTIPIVFGVVVITFTLFRLVAPDPARAQAGKFATPEVIASIRHRLGLDKPRWMDVKALAHGEFKKAFDSQFVDILTFRAGESWHWEESLWTLVKRKAPASLMIQVPVFFILLGLELVLALYVAARRAQMPDLVVTFIAVLGMSIPGLSAFIAAQWLFAKQLGWFPVAGWENGIYSVHFAALPVVVSLLLGIGGGTRFYRTVMLEEINTDYVRTARAKGVSNREILYTHVLRNAMIPVITNTVTALPGLVLGALLLERIFQIPGMGNLYVEAINSNDTPIVMSLTYILAITYCLLLLVSDILYAVVNPQVSLR